MQKNARYKGGSGTGVDLFVPLVDGQERRAHVDQGSALPTDFGGVAVKPEFIDGLLETSDWDGDPPADETAEQREARLAGEKEALELEEAAAAARDEHDRALEKAAAAKARAEKAINDHRAAGDAAAAAAVERVRAEQQIRAAQQILDAKGGTS